MKVLIMNQAYEPDVVSSGQHAADLGRELARRGHQVNVICSRRPYNGGELFARTEVRDGVTIHRVRGSSLGKASLLRRAVDFATFGLACAVQLMKVSAVDVVIVLTSPPLIASLGAVRAWWRGEKLVSWILDLNPDEAIAAGALRTGSIAARTLEAMLRFSLRHSAAAVVMDRFMAQRVARRQVPPEKIHVVIPWSLEGIKWDEVGRVAFRAEHGLAGRFVVMYAGNHSPCHPLDTLLEAALLLRDDGGIAFCFCGGGSEFVKVKEFAARRQLTNIFCVPYQPLWRLAGMLSAADLHTVVMGSEFIGIVHPCKVYNILTLGTPLFYVGPPGSHVAELGAALPGGYFRQAQHGEAQRAAEAIRAFAASGELPRLSSKISGSEALAQLTGLVETFA